MEFCDVMVNLFILDNLFMVVQCCITLVAFKEYPKLILSEKRCGGAPSLNNGTYVISGSFFGDTVTYSCATGYSLTWQSHMTCDENGHWAALPTCQSKVLIIFLLIFQGCQKYDSPRFWLTKLHPEKFNSINFVVLHILLFWQFFFSKTCKLRWLNLVLCQNISLH